MLFIGGTDGQGIGASWSRPAPLGRTSSRPAMSAPSASRRSASSVGGRGRYYRLVLHWPDGVPTAEFMAQPTSRVMSAFDGR